jgi:hypothetical protein
MGKCTTNGCIRPKNVVISAKIMSGDWLHRERLSQPVASPERQSTNQVGADKSNYPFTFVVP